MNYAPPPEAVNTPAEWEPPKSRCPVCGEVKFVGHGPLCGDCYLDRRPCRGVNANICVAEGCYGEACLNLKRGDA